jgi:hypothetical protein
LTGEEYFKEAFLVEMWNEIPINCIGVIFDYKNKRVKNLIENEIKEKNIKMQVIILLKHSFGVILYKII